MNRHRRLDRTLLTGFAALALSAGSALAADAEHVTAQQHETAAAAHEKAARHHRAAAQYHRTGEHGVAKAHAKEAEKTSVEAYEKTKTATTSSDSVKYQASLLNNER